MASLFAQTITQFAPLRTFARIPHTYASYSQLIRELFPKALFDEQSASYKIFIEIAWSFLSMPSEVYKSTVEKRWDIPPGIQHRVGGLPVIIRTNGSQEWHKHGKHHRDDKDLRTGLTLPAAIWSDGTLYWMKFSTFHRDDKDLRTNLTLPAIICAGGQYWYKDGKLHRVDKDPKTGLTLPAIIYKSGSQHWFINGAQIDNPSKTL